MSKPLPEVDAVVLDLDGVIYRGSNPIAGAAEAVAALRARGLRTVFATNNATRTVEQYVDHLAGFDIAIEPNDIVTAAVVTAEELERREWLDRSTFLVGNPGIQTELERRGISLVSERDARHAELVVVSQSAAFTYDDLRTASFALRGGAAFVATNDDPTFPASDGLWPGAGAIVAAFEVASGRRAEVMGKPNPPMMHAIARRLPPKAAVAVIGDQPLTDLAGGRAMGWMTILVLSGVTDTTSAQQLADAPDLVVADLTAFLASL